MARRNPKVLPLRPGPTKPITVQPLSDRDRLSVEKFIAAQEAVITQAGAALDAFLRVVMTRSAELDPDEGWMFNRQKMRWEKYPVPADA